MAPVINPACPGIVLASASPRRMELLRQIGVVFSVAEHQVLEEPLAGEAPQAFVRRMALEKAQSALSLLPVQALPVLGADTIVVAAGETDETIVKMARADENVAKYVVDEPKKTIVVKGKLVNFVV